MNQGSEFGQKIIEGGVFLSSGALAVRLIGLAVTFSLISFLAVKEYGTYKLVVAAFGFLASFFISGFDPIVINDLALERGQGRGDKVKRLFLEYSFLKLGIGLLLFLIAFFGAVFLDRFYNTEILVFFPTIAFLFLFVALERVLNLLLNLNVKFRLLALFTIVEEAAKLAAVLLLVWFYRLGTKGAILADVLSTGIAVLIFLPYGLFLLRKVLLYQASSEWALRSIARLHGKWAIASRYLGEVRNSIRPWLIKIFIGTEAVALYSLAESLYNQIVSLFPIQNVLMPLLPLEIKNRERIREVMLRGIKYGTPLFALVGIASVFVMPPLVLYLFPHYTPSLPLFYVILLTILTTATGLILTSILYAHREQRALFLITLLTIIFMVGTGALLLWSFGIIGIAIELVLTAVFYNALRLFYVFRVYPELRFPMSRLFTWTGEDWSSLRSFIVSLASFLIPRSFRVKSPI